MIAEISETIERCDLVNYKSSVRLSV